MISVGGVALHRAGGQHVREVLRELGDAVLDVALGLLAGLGEVHRADEAPLRAVGDVTVLAARSPPTSSQWWPSRSMPCFAVARDRQHPDAVLARAARAGRGERRRDRDVEARVAVRRELEARVVQREPVGLPSVTVSPREQRHDRVERTRSMRGRCSSAGMPSMCASDVSWPGPHPSIARPRVRWSSSTMRSASISGWWYGQRVHAGAEPDVLRALGGDRDEHLGRGDDLEARRSGARRSTPRRSRAGRGAAIRSRSRSSASVGFCPTGWNGAMKMPKRIRPFDPSPRR